MKYFDKARARRDAARAGPLAREPLTRVLSPRRL